MSGDKIMRIWYAAIALAFAAGGVIGCAIAMYTLSIRGLL